MTGNVIHQVTCVLCNTGDHQAGRDSSGIHRYTSQFMGQDMDIVHHVTLVLSDDGDSMGKFG